jgi:hypothetical protein
MKVVVTMRSGIQWLVSDETPEVALERWNDRASVFDDRERATQAHRANSEEVQYLRAMGQSDV